MEQKRGILLMALGHPYYGRMCHNLAISIKQEEPNIPIAVVWAGESLSHLKVFDVSKTFDYLIEAPKQSFTRNGNSREYIKSKTFMYDLSPFDETIYLDVDTLWLPYHSPYHLFELLKDTDFTAECRGFTPMKEANNSYVRWANMEEIRQAYDLPDDAKYYEVSSEFVYFKKTERTKLLFDTWKDNYDNLKVQTKIPQRHGGEINEFAGGIPDELPLAIAMMQTGIYPHLDTFVPIFWQRFEKRIPPTLAGYYALSVGGNINKDWSAREYDRINRHNMNAAGLKYIWPLQNKRRFLPERQKI